MSEHVRRDYATVNGLKMYYEIHGVGEPLVLLHGAFMSIDAFGPLLPALAESRQVIAIELEGHGRTADLDRPLRPEQMADDTAALMRHLDIGRADVFGYSLGSGVAMELARKHPDLVRKLVLAAATYAADGFHPDVLAGIETITPEAFAGSPMEAEYARLAPHPERWPTLIAKVKDNARTFQGWRPETVQAIQAPTLVIIGDSDIVRPEHAVDMFRLLGGGVAGDVAGLPQSQLAVLPGTAHITLVQRVDLLLAIITPFLDAPMPAGQEAAPSTNPAETTEPASTVS